MSLSYRKCIRKEIHPHPSSPNGDFQGRCYSLAATQADQIKDRARIDSGSCSGLLINTSSGWRQQPIFRGQGLYQHNKFVT